MAKIARFLIVLLIALLVAPVAFAKSSYPVYIKDVDVYTKTANQGIAGELTVCSTNYWRTKFTVKAKNLNVRTTYKRNLLMLGNECETFELDFTDKFEDITKAGDKIEFSLDDIMSQDSEETYREPKKVTVTVEEQDPEANPCGDKEGGNNEYEMCNGDYVTHTDTDVRVKLVGYKNSHKRSYVDLAISGIEWGGIKKLRIYSDREREVTSPDKTRVKISYLGRTESGNYLVQLAAK